MNKKVLSPPCVTGLKDIQENFAEYQSQAFSERSTAFFALELCGECGELANLEKKAWRDPTWQMPDSLADEAADVFITLINYCNARGFDVEKIVAAKLNKIEERRQTGRMGPSL